MLCYCELYVDTLVDVGVGQVVDLLVAVTELAVGSLLVEGILAQ